MQWEIVFSSPQIIYQTFLMAKGKDKFAWLNRNVPNDNHGRFKISFCDFSGRNFLFGPA